MGMTLFIMVLALLLDRGFGEPTRYHPLVGLGRYISGLEQVLHRPHRQRGVIAILCVTGPLAALGWALSALQPVAWLYVPVATLVLYACIGGRSLIEHAERIAHPLAAGDLTTARKALSYIVSRDTSALEPPGIALAASESVLENGNDALFGALFWFMVGGIPGVLVYRAANTLDAMWGYKTPRYRQFGWAAARLDDVLNYVPARLTVMAYAVSSGTWHRAGQALRCAWTQGRGWKSPNAGPVMAAGAGALNVTLGGGSVYHGQWQDRPVLGMGPPPDAAAIFAACRLVQRSTYIWLAAYAAFIGLQGAL